MKRQKESKVTKILMLILSLVFFTSTIVASSISKYVTQKQAYFGDKEHLDYTVNSVFVVRSQEELFAAINQGYTYVQLDQDIENPLIVTQKAETLNTDLILDLNGIEIQRNGYEPILNIKPGVRLTVVDTSSEQTGGLYNPVGSVFNIYGGTLTVVTGTFESGPRYSEYYSYNKYVLDGSNNSQTKRTLVEDAPKRANFYEKDASTGRFKPAEVKNLPIIKSYPEKTGNVEYNHGNLYFDEKVEIPDSDLVIEPDTYCYYRTSEDASVDTSADSMADWYYTYYVSKDNFTYFSHEGNEKDHIKITIFGYYNTIKQASAITDPAKYYAAIQMTSGTLDVQNGTFNQYFGVDTTACVNAQGGDINIKKGKFSSRVPNATYYTKYGKGTKEVDTVCFTSSYFDNYKWNDATTNYISGSYNGRLAKVGESYCILNGGSANVTIGTGDLYSSNNNIISMGGGALSISGGDFTKRVTNGINVADGESTEMAAINMQDGTLDISSATCSVFGDSSAGILMQKGKLTVEQTQFDLQGNVINGIYSRIDNDTDFQVFNSSFTLNGNNAVGIYSEYGKVNISADTSALLSIEGDNSYGIYVKNSGSVASDSYSYELNGDNSIGILAESDATGINVTNGSMNIVGSNTFGIKSSIVGDGKFTVKNLPITMTGGDTQTGIFAENGSVQVSADNPAEISTSGTTGRGIHVKNGGSVISTNYSYSLSGDESIGIDAASGAKGINVTNGEMNIQGNNSFGINSSISGIDTFNVKDLPITMTNGTQQTGIFAQNGRVNVMSTSSKLISIDGAQGKGIHVGAGGSVVSDNYSYKLSSDYSYGIYSIAGLVKISGGNITLVSNNQCYGVYAFSATEQIQIDIDGATIDVGYDGDDKTADTLASVGVFLATNDNTNKITLTDTDIKCYEVGVLIDGGSLDVKSTTTTANEISTKKASSIIVKGGNVLFDSTCNYNITSSNTIVFTAADTENTLKTYDTNLYDITIPELAGANIGSVDYKNTDGIYVEGGNFTVNGAVSITHTGLANDFDLNTAYATQIITSYAVRVTGGKVVIVPSNDAQNVKITANVGGGVFCGKSDTKNGELVLGRENAANSTVEVNALGNRNSYRLYAGETGDMGNGSGWNWSVPVNLTGGNAVELNGGSITLNCGTYSANFGNGILAKIPYQAVASASDYSYPTITVNNGIFKGQMNLADTIYNNDLDTTSSGFSGPASSYGIKVVGGADVQLFNGVYSGAAGGVMITGISDYDNYDGNWAKLRLYGGVYGCDSTTNFANASTDGIMIFDKSLIAIGGYDSANSDKANVNNLTIIAILCPISANPLPLALGKTRVASEVNIYYSKFIYDQAVIYNEGGNSATIKVYNRDNTNMYLQQDIGQRGNQADGTHTDVTHTGTKYFAVTDYSTTAQPYWNASTTTTN